MEGGNGSGAIIEMKEMAEEEEEQHQPSNLKLDGDDEDECTMDGSVDFRGRPARRRKSGGWLAGSIVLLNQGLATLAFFGVGVNLVIFLTRVLQQDNASAANNVSKWTGTVYLFSLFGAFLSDSYWGRFFTCAIFQIVFVLGLVMLSLTSRLFLLKPEGCGDEGTPCQPHSGTKVALFNMSVYLIALGNGGYQPNIATFGADQFDERHPREALSKVSFFSYFYLALNLGSLFSNTFLSYYEDDGSWDLGFWASAASAAAALGLFLLGTPRYRRFRPSGNPLSRVCQVFVAAARNWDAEKPGSKELFQEAGPKDRKLLHTQGFRFLDKAAIIQEEMEGKDRRDPWRLCAVTQVEEVKCVLRVLPIWLCTIIYSVVFTQMASIFVEQGAAMNTSLGSFHVPPASMSAFDILSVALFVFLYRRLLQPCRLTELQRMGIGLVIAIMAMLSAGALEAVRLKHICKNCAVEQPSSVSIMWQIPQYMLIGASEVFMYVGQLEFFNSQMPDGLKSFGSALCMTSMSLGNYVSSLIVMLVMTVTARGDRPGWIPDNLNKGHLDRFYFMLAILTAADLAVYIACAKWYKNKMVGREDEQVPSNENVNGIDMSTSEV